MSDVDLGNKPGGEANPGEGDPNPNPEGNAPAKEGDGGGSSGDGGKEPQPFPDDWRQQLAGDDEKVLKGLGKFTEPKGLLTSYLALEQRLATGDERGKLPEKYTDEELATFRDANGIPEDVEGYFKEMPDGLVIGDEDKEIFNDFAQAMHDKNVKPEIIHEAVNWYYSQQENQQAAQVEADEQHQTLAEDALRVEWAEDYRSNINTLNAYFDKAPEDTREIILNARGPDGMAIMNNPEVVKFLAAKAREENPYVTLTPQGSDNTALAERKATLETMMGDRSGEYWKGPSANKLQNEYRTILEAEERNAA